LGKCKSTKFVFFSFRIPPSSVFCQLSLPLFLLLNFLLAWLLTWTLGVLGQDGGVVVGIWGVLYGMVGGGGCMQTGPSCLFPIRLAGRHGSAEGPYDNWIAMHGGHTHVLFYTAQKVTVNN